jgi:hypothetical protein
MVRVSFRNIVKGRGTIRKEINVGDFWLGFDDIVRMVHSYGEGEGLAIVGVGFAAGSVAALE